MTKTEQRREEWMARIANYQSSGQTMKVWCATHNVSKDQLKYWQRNLKTRRASATPAPHFVPLTVQESPIGGSSPQLFIHVGAVRIELQAGFDAPLLRQAIAALTAPC